MENLYFQDPIQDTIFNDQFMERLLQIESELLSETCLDSINGSSSGEQSSQETQEQVQLCRRDNHFTEFQSLDEEDEIFNLLLTGAKAIDDSNWPLVCSVVERITNIQSKGENRQIKENPSSMASYFAQGLYCKCMDAREVAQDILPSHKITSSTIRVLLEQSPCVQFAHFTANQAILDAIQGENTLHVIDLEIMEGIQWPPLMTDLAVNENFSLKITAIIMDPNDIKMIHQTGKWLTEFAASLGLPFRFNQVLVNKEEDFDIIEADQTTVANCAIQQLHMPTRDLSQIRMFLNGVRQLSPRMIVVAEGPLVNCVDTTSISFQEFFSEAFQHYTAISDSLVQSFSRVGFRKLEREIMGPRIIDSLRNFPTGRRGKMSWKCMFSSLECLKPIPLSPCNVYQAKLLTGVFGRGYSIQNQDCRLSLCWYSRPLTTVTVWHA